MPAEKMKNENETGDLARVIREAKADGRALGEAVYINHPAGESHPLALVPDGYTVKKLDNSFLLDTPRPKRINRVVKLYDEESFIAYLADFSAKNTRIYAHPETRNFVTIIDDHPNRDAPDYCSHLAKMTAQTSPEFEEWQAASDTAMSQVEFAEFIDEHLADISGTAPGVLYQAVLNLRFKRDINFKSDINLGDGTVRMKFEEINSGMTAEGNVSLPDEIKIGIPVFVGGKKQEFVLKLRHRLVGGGKITLHYKMLGLRRILDEAFLDVCEYIRTKTKRTVYLAKV